MTNEFKNSDGELGLGDIAQRNTPTRVTSIGSVVSVQAHSRGAIALGMSILPQIFFCLSFSSPQCLVGKYSSGDWVNCASIPTIPFFYQSLSTAVTLVLETRSKGFFLWKNFDPKFLMRRNTPTLIASLMSQESIVAVAVGPYDTVGNSLPVHSLVVGIDFLLLHFS